MVDTFVAPVHIFLMQHDAAENVTEGETLQAIEPHVQELIEEWPLDMVLAYAAMRLAVLSENMCDENVDVHGRPTAVVREAETIGPVSGVVRRPRKGVG